MDKKYRLCENDTIIIDGDKKLYRIQTIKPFGCIREGDLGGYIEKESNLDHAGSCWVYDDARVYDDSKIFHSAKILHNSKIHGNANIEKFYCMWFC